MCNFKDLIEKSKQYHDPPLSMITAWLDQFREYRPNILLLGGEPLLRPDIPDILDAVKLRGMGCGVFTNGTLFTRENVARLTDGGVDYVVFSIHGDKKIHTRIVKSEKSWQRVIKGLSLFAKARNRCKIIINCMICEENLDVLEKVVEIGERYHIDAVRFGHPTFFTRGDYRRHNASVEALFPRENIPGISYYYDVGQKGALFEEAVDRITRLGNPRVFFSPELSASEVHDWYSPSFRSKRRCLFIWRGLNIYPNGDVIPCDSIGWVMGNLNHQHFNEIWNNTKYREFRETIRQGLLPGCARCCKL